MEMGGFYSLEKPGDFVNIVDLQFVAAMGHPGIEENEILSEKCVLPTQLTIKKFFYYNQIKQSLGCVFSCCCYRSPWSE